MTDTKERKAFEAAWHAEYPLHEDSVFIRSALDPNGYSGTRINDAWKMWQARAAQPCPVPAGYALVPAGWQFYDRENSRWCNGDDRIKDYRRNTAAAGYPVRDVYAALTQPATCEGDDLYYLQDIRSYLGNAPFWWAKDGNGYTAYLERAHRYTYAEAMRQHNARETDVPWPCSVIDGLRRTVVDIQDMGSVEDQIARLRASKGEA